MVKDTHEIRTSDAQIDAAIADAACDTLRAVVAATYDAAADAVEVQFVDGVQLRIPRRLLQGLEHGTPEQLRQIEIDGPGTGLVWPALDVAHYVPGLVAGVFGTRGWMAELGRRGGASKSSAKVKAARANGAKGGRPRFRGAPPGAVSTPRENVRLTVHRRTGHPVHVAALLLRETARMQVFQALRSRAIVTFCDDAEMLLRLVETGTVSAVVTDVHDAGGENIGLTLADITRRFPTLPVVICAPREPTKVYDLVRVPGSDTIVFQTYDELTPVVLAKLAALDRSAATVILDTVHRHAARGYTGVFDFLASTAARPITIPQVAQAVGIPRRSLSDQLKRDGFPPLEQLIGWMRLLHAAWALDQRDRSVDSVANELLFKSGSALRHMIKRYTSRTPSEIWSLGGFLYVMRQCELAVWGEVSDEDPASHPAPVDEAC